ncbi:Sphingolipid long chain base-responsive protein LSP1 [Grifola frondosa]|uniref:Sphingolipid long chain base-responsive protein LSP1 n=1 Tax=Grifola frondosa TaxID=5627 RepID=A0A1C7MSR7_GRIFR|nr:Sphingolipid long chain base-responsive protein LSP1 [Grifola frondosa]
MQGFFSSMADKAQSALNSTPLAGQHIPGARPTSAQASEGDQSGSGGLLKSHAFESLHHQLRTLQQQYSSSTTLVQKIITTDKGVAIDLDSVSRDAHAHSKELYTWGQNEDEDVKDVTDRLAWLNFIQGSLTATLAHKINISRTPFKALRDAENSFLPRRNMRAGFQTQIARIEHDQQKGMEQKLAELKKQLRKAEIDDEPLEKEIELLKRKAVRESEQMKWDAIREYSEKLVLLSQAAAAITPALPPIPPSKTNPYNGAQTTASVRTTLQQALDNYKTGDVILHLHEPSPADLNRSDTRSFGVTHAQELSRISSAEVADKPSIPLTPPPTSGSPPPAPSLAAKVPSQSSISAPGVGPPVPSKASPPQGPSPPPLNPATLNQSPSPIPVSTTTTGPVVAPNPTEPSVKMPAVTPTVAETGIPKSAGPDGPGPQSGSLRDLKTSSPASTPVVGEESKSSSGAPASVPAYGSEAALHHESAEDEKKRLEREERERVLRAGGSAPAATGSTTGEAPAKKFESAEEEKKRLEKEEREKLLAGGGSGPVDPDQKSPHDDGDGDLPPYQEF